jgi:cytochrome c oxidase subunit III
MSEASATLHEPFESAVHQREALTFGVWLFLASELLLFAGLFLGYAVYRHDHATAFAQAGAHANLLFGTVNTALLMTSSFSLSVANRATDRDLPRIGEIGIWITLALGLLFLGVKGLEYRQDLAEHLWPGAGFAIAAPPARIFFGFYWTMTLLHACHLSIGVLLLARLAWLARRGELRAHNDSVEATTLYWHLVDVIWAVLYVCIYLEGR